MDQSKPKYKYNFLIPIGSSINGILIPQLLELQRWCISNNGVISTVTGKIHSFARNHLATNGGGFVNSDPPDAEWLIWIDSDIVFNESHLKRLLDFDSKFCAGWYINDLSTNVMAGHMDKDFFMKNGYMPFLNKNILEKSKEPIEVDFTGFGFVKMHRSIIEKMTYPYFTLNLQKYGPYTDLSSEDISFCLNCYKETGIKPIIIPDLKVGHLKSLIL